MLGTSWKEMGSVEVECEAGTGVTESNLTELHLSCTPSISFRDTCTWPDDNFCDSKQNMYNNHPIYLIRKREESAA